VWRNGILIGDGLSAQNHGDSRCILIDGSRNFAVEGEFDYVCWEAGGVYPPVSVSDETPPAAPAGLAAEGGPGVVALDWDSNTEDDLAGYNVYRSETSGGPYDLVGSPSGSAYVDTDVVDGTTYYYEVTAVDGSENESEPSEEASATPGFNDPAEVGSFAHCLRFETDGELPPVEGAADGWTLDATWNADPDNPPTMSVSGGLLHFESVLSGQHALIMPTDGASAWSTEIDPSVSYTLEVSVRVESGTGGVVIWVGNGATRLILRVDTNGIFTWSGDQLHGGDNSSRLVAVRMGYDAVSGLYFVWRNGNLIGAGLAASAATNRTWVVLIDCCSSTQATGEFDHVCWDATGLYPPATVDDGVAPAAPAGLVAQGSIGAVALDWDSNTEDDLAGYNVWRSETAGGPYDLVAENIVASELADMDVINGTTYYYVVTATDIWGDESDPSTEASATPSLPEEVGATSFAHCLHFDEDGVLPSVEGAADGWAEDAAWNQNDPDPPVLNVFGGRLIFESVLPGQQAITMWTGSAWETEINSDISYTMEVNLRVTASSGDKSGAVLWLANGDTRLVLRVDTTGVYTWSGLELDTEGDNSSDFVTIRIGYDAVIGLYYVWRNGVLIGAGVPPDAAAHQGRTAVFLVDCCSTVQVAGEFDYVCWTPGGIYGPDLVAPAAPSDLVATAGESEVSLDWNDSAEADLAGYNVYRSEVSGGPYDLIAMGVAASDYLDDTAQNDVTYYYLVTAVDTSGNESDDSDEASATPADVTAPGAPVGLVATPGDNQVFLDWDDNTEADVAGYNVLRSEVSGGPYAEIATGVAVSEYLDDTAQNDVTYYYTVTAVDASGNLSEAAEEVSATPEAPGGLQRPGDTNQDGTTDISDAISLFDFLFLGNVKALPCGDTTGEDAANVTLLDWNRDSTLDLSDGVGLLAFLFQGGAPHPLGGDCVRIVGCPEACTP
jgi:fibronectin type 3 domain-containing protein